MVRKFIPMVITKVRNFIPIVKFHTHSQVSYLRVSIHKVIHKDPLLTLSITYSITRLTSWITLDAIWTPAAV